MMQVTGYLHLVLHNLSQISKIQLEIFLFDD